MADPAGKSGLMAFIPYGLPVLGGLIGMAWVRYGTSAVNPIIGVAGGAIIGRVLAMAIVRMAERAALNRPYERPKDHNGPGEG